MNKCNYCINKKACNDCDIGWHDKFIPNNKVRKYFNMGYNGVRGINGYMWEFDTTSEHLISTHAISIYGSVYCPYCGEKMECIQDPSTLETIGYCCICEGALAELEYERKLAELKKAYELDCTNLRAEYSDKLSFDTDKLLSIKHKIERERPRWGLSHFTTIIGKDICDINEMM